MLPSLRFLRLMGGCFATSALAQACAAPSPAPLPAPLAGADAPPWARRPAAVHATAAASPQLLSFSRALAQRLAAPGGDCPPVPLPACLPPLVARLGCTDELAPASTLHRDATVSMVFCTEGAGLDLLRGLGADGAPTRGGLPEVWERFGMLVPARDLLHHGRQVTLALIPRSAGAFAAEPATYEGLQRFVDRRFPGASALLARDLEAMRRKGAAYYSECEAAAPGKAFDEPPAGFRYRELQAARAALGEAADGPAGVPAWRVRQFLRDELRCNALFDGSGATPSGFPELFVENVPMQAVFAAGGVLVELGAAARVPRDVLQAPEHAQAPYTPFYAARAQ